MGGGVSQPRTQKGRGTLFLPYFNKPSSFPCLLQRVNTALPAGLLAAEWVVYLWAWARAEYLRARKEELRQVPPSPLCTLLPSRVLPGF